MFVPDRDRAQLRSPALEPVAGFEFSSFCLTAPVRGPKVGLHLTCFPFSPLPGRLGFQTSSLSVNAPSSPASGALTFSGRALLDDRHGRHGGRRGVDLDLAIAPDQDAVDGPSRVLDRADRAGNLAAFELQGGASTCRGLLHQKTLANSNCTLPTGLVSSDGVSRLSIATSP
jgi:hypothetical protein